MLAPKPLVHQTTESTGAGNLTLALENGKQSFALAFGTGAATKIFDYYISHRTAPEWEYGLGHMLDATTFVRDLVRGSSNAGAAVNFTAGTKDIANTYPPGAGIMFTFAPTPPADPVVGDEWMSADTGRRFTWTDDGTSLQWVETGGAGVGGPSREKLTANRTYYVRKDGNNANTGLADNAGGAFLTIQKAVDVVCGTLDQDIYDVTIQVRVGTYNETVTLKNYIGGSALNGNQVLGDLTTPANVLVQGATSNNAFTINGCNRNWEIKGFRVVTVTSGAGIRVTNGSKVFLDKIDFGACVSGHVNASNGCYVELYGTFFITGNAAHHIRADGNCGIYNGFSAYTISGSPAFSNAFMVLTQGSVSSSQGTTYSGAATGSRYKIESGAHCETGGAGINFFPGNAAGTGTNFSAAPWGLYT